jgi:KaiC/GvpD/RAD55 family RecA-like ATPase
MRVYDNGVFLPSGNINLNKLLCPDYYDAKKGGFLINQSSTEGKSSEFDEPPVILIEGDTGTGKTTLSLQIAYAAVKSHADSVGTGPKWNVFYYSLEQSARSLRNLSENFGFPPSENSNDPEYCFEENSIKEHIKFPEGSENAKFRFCRFSHRPISKVDDRDAFEQRLDELSSTLDKSVELINEKTKVVFFIDCLNALTSRILTRNDIYRLFQLFRTHKIPAVLTMEISTGTSNADINIASQAAEFLSDIAIKLSRVSEANYNFNYLEIIKSRVCKQVPGKHRYKIRPKPRETTNEEDVREEYGVVVFPSIHYVLSKSKEKSRERRFSNDDERENKFNVDSSEDADLGLILSEVGIKSNASIAIIGAAGTHKLALGMNFAMGRRYEKVDSLSPEYSHALVLNFGGSADFNFNGIAWTKFNNKFISLEDEKFTTPSAQKYWRRKYWIKKYRFCADSSSVENQSRPTKVTLLSFKIGQLTPEECFDVIETILSNNEAEDEKTHRRKSLQESVKSGKNPFSSVIICNTAELCTGFPLLNTDPLFLPSLIDLFDTHELATICIGVENSENRLIQDTNFALSARADYRINLYHFPDIGTLCHGIVYGEDRKVLPKNAEPNLQSIEFSDGPEYKSPRRKEKNMNTELNEQLVSLVIDNVSGRHYSRQPRWIYVHADNSGISKAGKTLCCTDDVNNATNFSSQ